MAAEDPGGYGVPNWDWTGRKSVMYHQGSWAGHVRNSSGLQRRWITWDELQNGEADRDVCMLNYSLERDSACTAAAEREEVRLTSRCARSQSVSAQRTGSQGDPYRRVAGVRAGDGGVTGRRGRQPGSNEPSAPGHAKMTFCTISVLPATTLGRTVCLLSLHLFVSYTGFQLACLPTDWCYGLVIIE